MQPVTLFTLFLLGFFSGTHCIGMCGGLSTAFALQLPPHIRRVWLIILMNLGRLASYTLIGALMGALSQMGSLLGHTHTLQLALFVFANLLLLFTGLYLAGVLALAAKIEGIGRPLWRRLQPLFNRLLPIRSVPACFGVGMLWGWLPCGLVYNASLYAGSRFGRFRMGGVSDCAVSAGFGRLKRHFQAASDTQLAGYL